MLLLTTAMKPLSACTTPRRLMAPISRHFLPVLQPEPPAWLTTGLRKGSRRPFALCLLSGATACSLAGFSPAAASCTPLSAALAASGALLSGFATAGVAGALPTTATAQTRFRAPLCFASSERGRAAEDCNGVPTATPLDLAGACVGLAATAAVGGAPGF